MEGLVQSEALLTKEGSHGILGETKQKKTHSSSKAKKKGNRRRNDSQVSLIDDSSDDLKIDTNYLASSYHAGIISGFTLISSYLESASSTERMVKVVVIGLGAGLLPMFLWACLSFLHIEVVELDSVVLNIARECFSFREDKRLKVHITDGIQFVRGVANAEAAERVIVSDANPPPSNGICSTSNVEDGGTNRVDILIVDVDSSDSSSGLTCPAADFVEESFLSAVKDSLSEQGLFIINLVSRSLVIRDMVVQRMKMVFSNLFHLQLEEDVNEVLFALNTENCIVEESFQEASCRLERLLKSKHPGRSQSIIDATKKIKRLK